MKPFTPTTAAKGSEERVDEYCRRVDALESEGYDLAKDNPGNIPSIFVEGDNNETPAEVAQGKRLSYPMHQSRLERPVNPLVKIELDEHAFQIYDFNY